MILRKPVLCTSLNNFTFLIYPRYKNFKPIIINRLPRYYVVLYAINRGINTDMYMYMYIIINRYLCINDL